MKRRFGFPTSPSLPGYRSERRQTRSIVPRSFGRRCASWSESTAPRLGYSGPDPIGRLLMGAKAHAIGVLPPGDMPVAHAVGSPFFREFMLGVAEVCDENDASLLVISGAENRKTWAIKNALVDGFILGHLEEAALVAARQRKTPFVVMDVEAGPEVNSVRVDGRGGARRAAEHLLDLGHRRFAIFSVLRKPADAIWQSAGQIGAATNGRLPSGSREAPRLRRRPRFGGHLD